MVKANEAVELMAAAQELRVLLRAKRVRLAQKLVAQAELVQTLRQQLADATEEAADIEEALDYLPTDGELSLCSADRVIELASAAGVEVSAAPKGGR